MPTQFTLRVNGTAHAVSVGSNEYTSVRGPAPATSVDPPQQAVQIFVLRGIVNSYHLKQLAQHGILDVMPEARVVNALMVRN